MYFVIGCITSDDVALSRATPTAPKIRARTVESVASWRVMRRRAHASISTSRGTTAAVSLHSSATDAHAKKRTLRSGRVRASYRRLTSNVITQNNVAVISNTPAHQVTASTLAGKTRNNNPEAIAFRRDNITGTASCIVKNATVP